MISKIYGVIDIGSNSVRAIVHSDGKILYRDLITSRLGEGLALTGKISGAAAERTKKAIKELYLRCVKAGAEEIFAFATETVRSAENGAEFVYNAEEYAGIKIDVVSGDEEGEIGLLGAFGGDDGAIIDIGGASAEITAATGGKIIYSHSLPLGAVRLFDLCGEDDGKLADIIGRKIREYGDAPFSSVGQVCGVGGTATTLGAVNLGMKKYDADKVDGSVLTYGALTDILKTLKALNVRERTEILGINEKRAEIIYCGAFLLERIMNNFSLSEITVREADNLLGYLYKRIYGKNYEK